MLKTTLEKALREKGLSLEEALIKVNPSFKVAKNILDDKVDRLTQIKRLLQAFNLDISFYVGESEQPVTIQELCAKVIKSVEKAYSFQDKTFRNVASILFDLPVSHITEMEVHARAHKGIMPPKDFTASVSLQSLCTMWMELPELYAAAHNAGQPSRKHEVRIA